MIRGARLLVGGGAAVAAPGLVLKVHAAGGDGSNQRKFRPSQLPVYGNPEPVELEVIPESDSAFRQYISSVRKWTWKYMDSIQSTTDKVKEKYEVGKAHTQDALAYIREDSAVIPRATIITVAGLGGIVAGYKGGLMRKATYASIGMTAAASICYPHEAGDIAKKGWHGVRDFAYKTYDGSVGGSKATTTEAKKPKVAEVAKHEDKPQPPSEKPSAQPQPVPNEKPSAPAPKQDFGMSKPEDKDLYPTRGN
jgi:hypothetical protein